MNQTDTTLADEVQAVHRKIQELAILEEGVVLCLHLVVHRVWEAAQTRAADEHGEGFVRAVRWLAWHDAQCDWALARRGARIRHEYDQKHPAKRRTPRHVLVTR